MPRTKDLTHRQTIFLKAFRTHPNGPPPDAWPSPAILRRWRRRPTFRRAMDSLLESLRFQSDFQIAMTATQAARVLAAKTELSTLDFQRLLRIGHLRQRFTENSKPGDQNEEQDDDDHRHEDHDPYECMKQILPEYRLTKEEFHDIAWRQNYGLPLRDCPDFPPPTPQDTFYYRLIMNPPALLYYMHLYGKHTNDHRHSPILAGCLHLIPTARPDEPPLPKFLNPSDPNPAPPSHETP